MDTAIFMEGITVHIRDGFLSVTNRIVFGEIKKILKEKGLRIRTCDEQLRSAEKLVVAECGRNIRVCNVDSSKSLTDEDVITSHMHIAVVGI